MVYLVEYYNILQLYLIRRFLSRSFSEKNIFKSQYLFTNFPYTMAYIGGSMRTIFLLLLHHQKKNIEIIQRDIYLRVYLPRIYLIENFKEIFIKIGSPSRKFSSKKIRMKSN